MLPVSVMTILRAYLDQQQITQAEFAKKVGVPAAMISQWASGSRRPSIRYAVAIQKATKGKIKVEAWAAGE